MPGLFAGLGVRASAPNEQAEDNERSHSSNANKNNMSSDKADADKDAVAAGVLGAVGAQRA